MRPKRLRRVMRAAILLIPFALGASPVDEAPGIGTLHWKAETGG
jgi:hypothetical protein